MLIIFISLIKIDELIIINVCEFKSNAFIAPSIKLISQFFAGVIGIFKNNYSDIELIQSKPKIRQTDSQIKIYILIIFASYFNYVGTMVRKQSIDFKLENRTRGFQIIFSALLCYFTIGTNIYKHHLFSLTLFFLFKFYISLYHYFNDIM